MIGCDDLFSGALHFKAEATDVCFHMNSEATNGLGSKTTFRRHLKLVEWDLFAKNVKSTYMWIGLKEGGRQILGTLLLEP